MGQSAGCSSNAVKTLEAGPKSQPPQTKPLLRKNKAQNRGILDMFHYVQLNQLKDDREAQPRAGLFRFTMLSVPGG